MTVKQTDFEIERGIPLPDPNGHGRSKYPFPDMLPGDSFLVTGMARNNLYAAASHFGRRNGWKFSIRKVEDGLRCWRVS